MARLQRFYGARPQDWLELDPVLRDGLIAWRPRLEAEEALHGANLSVLAWIEQKDRKALLDHWRSETRRGLDGHGGDGVHTTSVREFMSIFGAVEVSA